MKQLLLICIFLLAMTYVPDVSGQSRSRGKLKQEMVQNTETPRLMVGIVVDQMRYDYLSRFYSHFGDGGFKRLMQGGHQFINHHFDYAPTKTAPGHAAIYTGSTPATSGIMGNDWFDRGLRDLIYCVDDASVDPVGTQSDHGRKSPHRLLTRTITDQLRLHHQMRSKTISIAFKDRSAILPGGYSANGAYWFYGENEGRWISSTHYMDSLPPWVSSFNQSDAVRKYKKIWNTYKDINTYTESGPDDTPYEKLFTGLERSVFPYDIPSLWEANGQFTLLKYTPFSNSLTTDFAMAAILNEELGKDDITDFLAISYSGTDEIGHNHGVNSKEVQDAYIQLDADLERFLDFLDRRVGNGNYTVFLTADHGVVHVPAFLRDNGLPGGYFSLKESMPAIKEKLQYRYGSADLIIGWYNDQIFLDHRVIENLEIELADIQQALASELLNYPQIDMVLTGKQLENGQFSNRPASLMKNGFHPQRSGDVYYVLKPGYLDYGPRGTDHGSPHIYDTHVPLIFYGFGISPGKTTRLSGATDIAPTLAHLMGIAVPPTSTGQPLLEILK